MTEERESEPGTDDDSPTMKRGGRPAGQPDAGQRSSGERPAAALGREGGPAVARRLLPLVLLAAGYTAYFWSDPIGGDAWSPFGGTPVSGDSGSYLEPGSEAGAGYPLFLDLVAALFGTPAAAPRVQLVLAAAAILFLGAAVSVAWAAPRLAFGLTAALFAASAVPRFHAYLLSEALFVPLLGAMLGGLVLAARRLSWPPVAFAASMCGLAIAARPAGAVLLPVWPLAAWLLWRASAGQRGRLAAAALLPLALPFLLEARAWARAEGDLVGQHLFAKALLIPSEPPPSGDAAVDAVFAAAREATAPLRKMVSAAPDPALRSVLLRRSERTAQHLRYLGLEEQVGALAEVRGTGAGPLVGAPGRSALLAAPTEWAANAATHFFALFAHPTIHTESFAREFAARTADPGVAGAYPGSRIEAPLPRTHRLRPLFVGLARVLGGAVFLVSAAALLLAAGKRLFRPAEVVEPPLVAAALAALSVLSYYLAVSILNFATIRYAAALWGAAILCGFAILCFLLPRIVGAARGGTGRPPSPPPGPDRSR